MDRKAGADMTDRELLEAAARAVGQICYTPETGDMIAKAFRQERGYSPTHGQRAAAAMKEG